MWRAHSWDGGSKERGNVRRKVGWRPVGCVKCVEKLALARWCREGNEKRVGSDLS